MWTGWPVSLGGPGLRWQNTLTRSPGDAPVSDVWLFVAKKTASRYSTSLLYHPGPRPGGHRTSSFARCTVSNPIPALTDHDRSLGSNLHQERGVQERRTFPGVWIGIGSFCHLSEGIQM